MATRRTPRQAARRRHSAAHSLSSKSSYRRALRFEPLEDRRLLALVTVTTAADTIDFNDGLTSLREAIFATNLVAGADTIDFAPSLTAGGPATILLTQGELDITDDLTINGPGASLLTIDASGSDTTPGVFDSKGVRIFNVSNGTSSRIEVSIAGLRLTGGDASGSGGALSSAENLYLADMVVEQNGGAISVVQSTGKLTMDRSHIVNNTVLSTLSGASTLNMAESTIRESEISFNSGGGITAGVGESGNILIADTTIADNAGTGATVKSTNNFQLVRSTISGNVRTGGPGGLSLQGVGMVLISDSVFHHNIGFAGSQGATPGVQGGGGANISATTITVQNSSFIDNRAPSGAGLMVIGNLTVSNSEFRGNATTIQNGGGGGLLHAGGGSTTSFVITGSTFAENVAGQGGGIYISLANNRTAILADNTFIANTADTQGGAIAISATGGTATINRTTIHGNHSAVLAGGMWLSASGTSRIRVESSTIDGNSSRGEGGGGATIVASGTAEVTFLQTTVSGNSSTGSGGGLAVNAASTSTVSIAHSTITKNGFRQGGGISNNGNGVLRITHSIIAGNFGPGTIPVGSVSPDLRGTVSNLNVSYSLVGNSAGSGLTPAPVGSPDANGNLIGGTNASTAINPRLASLADNGGPTQTHALLSNSPALNAGNPAAAPGVGGVPVHDQRGVPFIRIYGGRIDMGSFEVQPTDRILGDYNGDNTVDAGDYFVWRSTVGSTSDLRADGNGDGVVDDADRAIWMANFGESHVATALSSVETSPTSIAASAQTTSVTEQSETPARSARPMRREAGAANKTQRHDLVLEAWATSNYAVKKQGDAAAPRVCTDGEPISNARSDGSALDQVFAKLGVTKRRMTRVN